MNLFTHICTNEIVFNNLAILLYFFYLKTKIRLLLTFLTVLTIALYQHMSLWATICKAWFPQKFYHAIFFVLLHTLSHDSSFPCNFISVHKNNYDLLHCPWSEQHPNLIFFNKKSYNNVHKLFPCWICKPRSGYTSNFYNQSSLFTVGSWKSLCGTVL